MVILHVAMVDQNPFAGVNVAVKSFLRSQSMENECALWNMSKRPADGVQNEFSYNRFRSFSQLPDPFCHPDLLVFHEIYHPPFLRIFREAQREKLPYIVIPHGCLTKKAQSIKKLKKLPANLLLFDRFIRHAAGIQYLSKREQQESNPKEKAFIATNGVEMLYPKEQFHEHVSVIVYIGRLDLHIKGLDIMLAAVSRTRSLFVERGCRLFIYGPDENNSSKTINDMIRSMELEQIVAVCGPVSGAQKAQILLQADCFMQTSRSEGMSMGILEALAYGLPCIITEGTSMNAFVDAYDAGWTCRTDPNDLAQVLTEVLSSSNALPKKSSGAIRLIEECFLTAKVTEKTIEIYKRMI